MAQDRLIEAEKQKFKAPVDLLTVLVKMLFQPLQ